MEPSTRDQIQRLITKLAVSQDMSVLLITQDVASILPATQYLTLLYCGQLMETGDAATLLDKPANPYTDSMFQMSLKNQHDLAPKSRLPTLPGAVPTLRHMPIGCRLGPRCPHAQKRCVVAPGAQTRDQQLFHCHYPLNEPQS